MRRSTARHLALLAGAALLCGCAYHPGLSGQASSADVQAFTQGRISFDGVARYDALRQVMLARLHERGITATSGSARAHLSVHQIDTRERTLSFGRDVKPRDIELTMTARFSWSLAVKKTGERRTYGPFTFKARRLYEYDDLNRQAGIREARRAKEILHAQAVNVMLERLERLLPKRVTQRAAKGKRKRM